MKTQLILTLAVALSTTAWAQEQPVELPGKAGPGEARPAKPSRILTARAARIAEGDPSSITEFDVRWEERLGADWKEKLADPANDENELVVDAYIEKEFPLTSFPGVLSKEQSARVVAHIAAKPEFIPDDWQTLMKTVTVADPNGAEDLLSPRMDELMAIDLGSGAPPLKERRYQQKYNMLHGKAEDWRQFMTIEEWLELSTHNISVQAYRTIQAGIRDKATEVLASARLVNNESVAGPEFDALLAPVVAALNAPLFAGLGEALSAVGVTVTMPDYSDVVEKVRGAEIVIMRRSIPVLQARRLLGLVVIVKGVDGYNAWRNALTQP